MNYALIDQGGNIPRMQNFDEPPILAACKGLRWVPANPPAYDPNTQTCTPITPVTGDEVTYTVAVRIPTIPQSVTMRQARLALFNAGVLATVDAAVVQAGEAAQIEWEYATEVKKDWPLVVQLATALNLDLDALMIVAGKL